MSQVIALLKISHFGIDIVCLKMFATQKEHNYNVHPKCGYK